MKQVKFFRTSPISGKQTSMVLEVDMEKLVAWESGSLYIQNAFPHLSSSEREFIKTGITIEEQNIIFPEY